MKISFLLLAISLVDGQCPGSCQVNTLSCPVPYKSGLCPGPSNVQCCVELTPSCAGMCQSNSLSCHGTYQTGKCPGDASVQCCHGTQPFADRYWNCADVGCTSTVAAGSAQPNYECAEFVARSLAAGGYVPGLTGLEAQSKYDPYVYGSKSYDLLWVSSQQGGPLGLREYLLAAGWKSGGSINMHSAVIVTGSTGPYGHVAIGVDSNVCDAHNMARFHITSCSTYYSVTQVLNPPALGANETLDMATEPNFEAIGLADEVYIPHAERMAQWAKEGKPLPGPV